MISEDARALPLEEVIEQFTESRNWQELRHKGFKVALRRCRAELGFKVARTLPPELVG